MTMNIKTTLGDVIAINFPATRKSPQESIRFWAKVKA